MTQLQSDIVVKESTLAKYIGIALLFALGVGFLFWLYKKIAGNGGKVNFPPAQLQAGGGAVDPVWDSTAKLSYVTDLEKVLNKTYHWYSSWWTSSDDRCKALKRTYQLNDNQLRKVHNAYMEAYKSTIRRDLQDVNTDGCGFGEKEYGDLLINRLNNLNLA